MRKTLLTTVSVIALGLGSAAFADDANTQTDADIQAQTEMNDDMNVDTGTGVDTQVELGADTDIDVDTAIDSNAASTMAVGAYSAEDLIGGTVVGSDGEEIADVDDLVIDGNNQIVDVLVNVGGFLGLGEKVVALDVNQLDVSHDEDGDTLIVTSLTKEDLEGMADYEASADYRLQSEIDSGAY